MTKGLDAMLGLGRPRLLVLGDLILDRYTWGNADRVSPEAPVLVLEVDRREARLGGAGAVASLLRGLDADVALAGVVGDDASGAELLRLLEDSGIDACLVDTIHGRPTTTKERLIGRASHRHAHQILRVDTEVREALHSEWQESMRTRLRDAVTSAALLLISDYAKGCCPPDLLRTVIESVRRRGIPVVIDPARQPDYQRYRGASVLAPNRGETSLAIGRPIVTVDDGIQAGRQLCQELQLDGIVVKLDLDGMVVATNGGSAEVIPARRRSVYDVTGAGDMVLAMLGLALASGRNLVEAAKLANAAAGLEVERMGVTPISRDELRAELAREGTA